MYPDYDSILKREFDSKIRRRGRLIFEEDAVELVELDESGRIISGLVIGSFPYTQEIRYASDGKTILHSFCTCPYGEYCKHQVALLLAAKQEYAQAKIIEIKPSTKTPSKSSEVQGIKKPLKRSEFIHIPTTDIKQIKNAYCKKRIPNAYRNSNFSIEITQEYHILMLLFQSSHSWTRDMQLVAQVEIKTVEEGDELYLKCSECDTKSKYLCEHEHIVLHHLEEIESGDLITQSPSFFRDIIARSAEDFNLTLKDFQQNFAVVIQGDYISIGAKSQHIVVDPEAYEMVGPNRQNDQEAVVDKLKKKLKETEYSYGLEWQHIKQEEIVNLIQGKPRKSDGVLKSRIREVDQMSRVKSKIGKLYKQISEIEMESEFIDLDNVSYNNIHNILKKEIDFLTRDYHYYYPYNDFYYSYKKKISEYQHFKFTTAFVDIKARLTIQNGLFNVHFILSVEDKKINIEDISFYNQFFIVANKTAHLFKIQKLYFLFKDILKNDTIAFLPNDKNVLLEQIAKLKQIIEVDISPDVNVNTVVSEVVKKSMYLSRQDDAIFFEPKLHTESNTFSILDAPYQIEHDELIEVNPIEVEQFLELLRSLHPDFIFQLDEYGFLFLDTNQFVDKMWFYDFYEICKDNDIELFGQENLSDLNYSTSKAAISSSISSGIDWFEVDVEMSFGEQSIHHKSWIKAIKANQKFIKLDDGSLGIIPEEWFEKLRKLHSNTELIDGDLKISKFNFNVIDDLFENIDDENTLKEIAEKRAKINSIQSIDTSQTLDLPKAIQATLRPYQHQGYNWLRFLNENKFGGILADDMGLGKTLQVICILAFALEEKDTTNLVVVPRSLLFNWSKEIEKFAPTLNYIVHHGPKREKKTISKLEEFDILISTYDTVTSDILLLKDIQFNYAVLDESQAIKNPNSKRFKAMRLLHAQHKLTMTGTPIENNTFDLYAQLSFVNPGCLGSTQKFKERFSTPIDTNGDEDVAKMLKQLIYPFLLRRTKQQVASDLPEKTESIIYCDMANDQRKKYEDLKLTIKNDVYKLIETEGLNRSRFKILEGLLRLRQMCNSPQILMPESKDSSAKLNTIEDYLTGELANKNVLIFSQFVSMLSLIKASLEKLNIKYAYLDGQTKNREKAVSQFTDDDSCTVFLISLKAGNTGLNLTKADYVFIVDPWWNPAVEAQAIDRTHRIGQDKQVFAYRLICKDTIEEKIMELKAKKRKVATDIIQVDDQVFKSMGKDQILNLFE